MGKMPAGGCLGEQEWVDDVVTDRCPVMFQDDYSILFQAYYWADKGFLPYAGGWADQPTGLLEGLNIMFNEAQLQQSKLDKQAANRRPSE